MRTKITQDHVQRQTVFTIFNPRILQ